MGGYFFISLPTMSGSESSVTGFRQVTFHYLLGYVTKAFISHLISNCWFYYSPCTDVFCRQLRILRFTCRREHCKCKAGCTSSDGISRDKRTPRERDPTCHEYWDKKLDKEESVGTFLSAISTLIEDAPEIMLLGMSWDAAAFNMR